MAARGTQMSTDIPEEKVKDVVAGFQVDAPFRVETIKQPNGLWTVIAEFSEDKSNISSNDRR